MKKTIYLIDFDNVQEHAFDYFKEEIWNKNNVIRVYYTRPDESNKTKVKNSEVAKYIAEWHLVKEGNQAVDNEIIRVLDNYIKKYKDNYNYIIVSRDKGYNKEINNYNGKVNIKLQDKVFNESMQSEKFYTYFKKNLSGYFNESKVDDIIEFLYNNDKDNNLEELWNNEFPTLKEEFFFVKSALEKYGFNKLDNVKKSSCYIHVDNNVNKNHSNKRVPCHTSVVAK